MKKIKCKWLGPTGITADIGSTVTGEEIFISEDRVEKLLRQKLIAEVAKPLPLPTVESKPVKKTKE